MTRIAFLVLLAPLGSGCIGSATTTNNDPVGIVVQAPYQGIYVLGNATLNTLDDADHPFVEGFALRVAWTELDGATMPAYDFHVIADAVAQLSVIDKKLSITLDAQLVPDYVLAAAKTTYVTTLPGGGGTAETAVTWDQPTLASYTAFVDALATLKLCPVGATCDESDKITLAAHPTLAGIRTNIIGMGKLRQTSNDTAGTIFEVANYRRGTFIAAVLANLHVMQDRFQHISTWVPYFSVDDSISGTTQDPTLDEALIAAITTEFDGSSPTRPVIGFFEELLKANSPDATSQNGINLLAARAAGGFVAFQACGGWTNGSLCNFIPNDTTPANGFNLGYGTYGARYYELYTADISNETLVGPLTTFDTFFTSPTAAHNPVALVGRPGSSSHRNVLTWADTATTEQGWIVERAVLPSMDFAPLGDPLAPDTTTYTDTTVIPNTSYAYRVHAYANGGDYILSNTATVGGH